MQKLRLLFKCGELQITGWRAEEKMQQKVLAAGYSRGQFEEAQREWMKYGTAVHREESISDAVRELLDHNDYQLIILF